MLDACGVVAAARSRRGASFEVLSRVGTGVFEIAVSVPLVLQYEAVLVRQAAATGLSRKDVSDLLDYVCSVARRQTIFFLWRPLLNDPNDDMVAEVGVAADCDAIITHNTRDFTPMPSLGIAVLTPGQLLRNLRESP